MPGGARTTLERVIVERDEILAAIKSRLDEAARGTGSFVLLGGEAGSGKTSVGREVVARWGSNLTVVQGACDPLSTARPLGPFLEVADHGRRGRRRTRSGLRQHHRR